MIFASPAFRTILAIAVGGVVGASLRWVSGEVIGTGWLPWSILFVNVVGSFVLAWVASAISGGAPVHRNFLLAAGSGFCGSFTTFAGFAVGVAGYIRGDAPGRAAVYVIAMLVLGLGATVVGRVVYRRTAPGLAVPQIGDLR